jgi:hypothetical protein
MCWTVGGILFLCVMYKWSQTWLGRFCTCVKKKKVCAGGFMLIFLPGYPCGVDLPSGVPVVHEVK